MTFLLFFKFFVSNISVHQYVPMYGTTGVILLMIFCVHFKFPFT